MERTTLGHLALHYAEGDEAPARRLLTLLGCTLVDNGPNPGHDGFCTILLDADSATYADNLMFLSRMSPAQVAVEDAVREQLRIGTADQAEPVTDFRELKERTPELAAHIGIRFGSLEALEQTLVALEDERGRVARCTATSSSRSTARSRVPTPTSTRGMAASPAFTGDELEASYGDHWIQCFVKTDLFASGILAFGQTIELDYVFEPFFAASPTFG